MARQQGVTNWYNPLNKELQAGTILSIIASIHILSGYNNIITPQQQIISLIIMNLLIFSIIAYRYYRTVPSIEKIYRMEIKQARKIVMAVLKIEQRSFKIEQSGQTLAYTIASEEITITTSPHVMRRHTYRKIRKRGLSVKGMFLEKITPDDCNTKVQISPNTAKNHPQILSLQRKLDRAFYTSS